MKLLLPTLSLIAILSGCMLNSSSENTANSEDAYRASIIGTWKGTEFRFDQTSAENKTHQFENYPDRHPKTTLRFVNDSTFNFIVDTYTVNETGNYEIDGDKLWLGGYVKTEYTIESISATELYLSQDVLMEFPNHTFSGKLHLFFERQAE